MTVWDLLQAIIPVANRQSLDMARRCKELRNIHQIKSTIHCLGINLTNIWVLWDHIWLNSCRFLTSVGREMWSDRGDSMFYSLIGRSISVNWAFVPLLGVLIPQRVTAVTLLYSLCTTHANIDCLVEDRSNSIANALELLKFCTKLRFNMVPSWPFNTVLNGQEGSRNRIPINSTAHLQHLNFDISVSADARTQ